jgi:glyoxylase I family protein
VEIKGIVFAGTATPNAEATKAFFGKVLSVDPEPLEGFPAHVFHFPDGSSFGVVHVPSDEMASRPIGFKVDDLDAAIAELTEAGIELGSIGESPIGRYVHFNAPDGHLYELVETSER